jgi:hypothetical protein
VGNPLPPLVRIPQPISDLKVSQSADKVILTWTNPARYTDNVNAATDLAEVVILQNGVPIRREPITAAGQTQSYTISDAGQLDSEVTFAVQVATGRGRVSAPSNPAPIRPVEVPSAPRNLTAVADQSRIILDWQPPERNPQLVERYRIQRSDWPAPREEQTLHFEDSEYDADMTYTYTVTALRSVGDIRIPGQPGEPLSITATDKKEPSVPMGLSIVAVDKGVFLTWTPNQERDLKEYLIFRSDQPEKPIGRAVAVGYSDEAYRPGLSYQLAAVDDSANESKRSMPVPGP